MNYLEIEKYLNVLAMTSRHKWKRPAFIGKLQWKRFITKEDMRREQEAIDNANEWRKYR